MDSVKYRHLILDHSGGKQQQCYVESGEERMSYASYKLVLTLSLFLILAGLLLTAFTLFSAQWQVAEIAELSVTHHHGIWWDCIIPSTQLIPLDQLDTPRTERCVYKFDPAAQEVLRRAIEKRDAASQELLLHRFLPQHKAVIFFGVFTFLFGLIGSIIGICSPCFPPNSLLYVVAMFMTTACSILADIIFVFAALRIDTKKAGGVIGNYQNRIGLACYLHILASSLFSLSLIFSIVAAYLLISCNDQAGRGCCARLKPKIQFDEEDRWHGTGMIVRACDRTQCKPFVIVQDNDSS